MVGLALLPLAAMAMSAPPEFVLNVSAVPRDRWNGALELIRREHGWADSWQIIFEQHNASLFNKLSADQWQRIGSAVANHFPDNYQELEGLSQQFMSVYTQYVSVSYLAGWVYYHELAHTELVSAGSSFARECTALIAESTDGTITHVANMDQSPTAVRKSTLAVRFVGADGETLFSGVDWYWFTTGVSRAVRRGLASIQENWRTTSTISLDSVLSDISAGVVPQILIFRRAFSSPPASFDALVQQMSGVRLAAPFYVAVAGTGRGQGVVLARNQTAVEGGGPLRLGSGANTTWFIAQTNYDHWLPDPVADPRRSVATRPLEQFGRTTATTPLGLFAVASTYPVHNPHTAYTAVMSARDGSLSSFVRTALCPEDPVQAGIDSRYCSKIRYAE